MRRLDSTLHEPGLERLQCYLDAPAVYRIESSSLSGAARFESCPVRSIACCRTTTEASPE
jgi:hypothetical protein